MRYLLLQSKRGSLRMLSYGDIGIVSHFSTDEKKRSLLFTTLKSSHSRVFVSHSWCYLSAKKTTNKTRHPYVLGNGEIIIFLHGYISGP